MAQRNISKNIILQRKYKKILDTFTIPLPLNTNIAITPLQLNITPISSTSTILIKIGMGGSVVSPNNENKFGILKNNIPLGNFEEFQPGTIYAQNPGYPSMYQNTADMTIGRLFNVEYQFEDTNITQQEINYSAYIKRSIFSFNNAFLYINRDGYRNLRSNYSYIELIEISL